MYQPDITPKQLDPLWDTIVLSTRDVSQNIPINFDNTPGVVLTAACFADGLYTFDKLTCISNLLAFGYRRLVVDLYWLTGREANGGMWSFCPSSSGLSKSGTTSTTTSTSSTPSSTATVQHSRRANDGSYKCESNLNASTFFNFLSDWIRATEYNIYASVGIIILNLHDDQSRPVTQGSSGTVQAPLRLSTLNGFPSSLIYTPQNLHSDRTNLNTSWLEGGDAGDDEARYFGVQKRKDGGYSSMDAWPSGSFLTFDIHNRLLLAFGDVQVAGFDPGIDENTIFQPEDMGWPFTTFQDAGVKCFFDPSKTHISQANNSWGATVDTLNNSSKSFTVESIREKIGCGYSILINTTLSNLESYFSLVQATVWSWATGQPASTPPPESNTPKDMFRCAAMRIAQDKDHNGEQGRWYVQDCHARYFPACRLHDTPYNWTLGTRPVRYFESPGSCPRGSAFDVPRTALENNHLLSAIKVSPPIEHYVWLDFQSLAVQKCWTSGGPNAPCPYDATDIGNKAVVVPTVAAIIVVIVAGLMGFAKLGGRRWERVGRKRRKMRTRRDEAEYEGVPA